MLEDSEINLFETIVAPLQPFINEAAQTIKPDSETYKLSLVPFIQNLLFGVVAGIKTVGLLITEIKTSPIAKELNLVNASKSMYSEAFSRYEPELFRNIFCQLLNNTEFIEIPEINSLGRILLIDGSVFPAISTMEWAKYKETANALKLHLAFELNRMIPVQFISTEANYSERKFLEEIIEKGETYVCDRGYISFKAFAAISLKEAFFIIRGKSNMKYSKKGDLDVTIPDEFAPFLTNVKDTKVEFIDDKSGIEYRIVSFSAIGESYILITNRLDLTTYEVIMLYAYRWQVELYFRFLKRTLNCIHLMSHDPKGIEIQFYIYMITYLLLISLKQKCETINEKHQVKKPELKEEDKLSSNSCNNNNRDIKYKQERRYVRGLVTLLGKGLQKYWKIGIHWLTVVRNLLLTPFNLATVRTIVLRQ